MSTEAARKSKIRAYVHYLFICTSTHDGLPNSRRCKGIECATLDGVRIILIFLVTGEVWFGLELYGLFFAT